MDTAFLSPFPAFPSSHNVLRAPSYFSLTLTQPSTPPFRMIHQGHPMPVSHFPLFAVGSTAFVLRVHTFLLRTLEFIRSVMFRRRKPSPFE